MTNRASYQDGLYRLGQIGDATGIQLVRLINLDNDNRYNAKAIEFTDNDDTQLANENEITVTNLAEPADADGQVPANTETIAVDVEGRWVVFLRPAKVSPFPARIVSSQGNAVYTMREQEIDATGDFGDKLGTSNFTAINMAELSLGPGAAVDDNTIVLVTAILDTGSPATARYLFDHPTYAKYLD